MLAAAPLLLLLEEERQTRLSAAPMACAAAMAAVMVTVMVTVMVMLPVMVIVGHQKKAVAKGTAQGEHHPNQSTKGSAAVAAAGLRWCPCWPLHQCVCRHRHCCCCCWKKCFHGN